MYARVNRWTVLAQEAVEDFRVNTIPAAKGMAGIQELLLLVNDQTRQAISISLWESEESMRASESRAQQLRDQDVEQGFAQKAPTVEQYRIAVRETF
jgi:heme-degrading monooxygenase HmoA